MRKNLFLWAMLLVAMVPAGCSEEEFPEAAAGGDEITITVGMPEALPEGRMTYVGEGEKEGRLRWDNGDELVAAGFDAAGKYIATSDFVLQSGAGTSEGVFKGSAVAGAAKYKVYYKNDNLNLLEGVPHPDYSVQTMSNGTVMQKVLYKYMILASYISGGDGFVPAADFETGNFLMKIAGSIMKFVINIPESLQTKEGVEKLVWTSNYGTAKAKSVTLNMVPQSYAKKLTCYVSFSDMDLEPGGKFFVKIGNNLVSCTFEAVSAAGKKYTPGGRATAEIATGWK